MEPEEPTRQKFGSRLSATLEQVEAVYLKILRAVVLIIATMLILYAAWLAVHSLYLISQSPDSVAEEVASVTPQELVDADLPVGPAARGSESGPVINPQHQAAYGRLLRQYYQLFSSRFEPFRRPDDRRLSLEEFDDNFVNTGNRLAAVSRGELSYSADIADLESLVRVMTEAAGLPTTQRRLRTYQGARRVSVCNNVRRMRTTYRESWDPYSYNCANWYEAGGCPVRRAVQTPYTERVCNMRLPEGTQSHAQIFRAFQNQFYTLLNERRETNAAQAQQARLSILGGIEEGYMSLTTALKVLGGFIVLMFFFLLIAIERHQRKMILRSDEM